MSGRPNSRFYFRDCCTGTVLGSIRAGYHLTANQKILGSIPRRGNECPVGPTVRRLTTITFCETYFASRMIGPDVKDFAINT